MIIQYRGFENVIDSRIYSFHVINVPEEAREFTVKVLSKEFCVGRLKFQDGPGVCMARLQRELEVETHESRAESNLNVLEQDVMDYRTHHYPAAKSSGRN
ncbi:MAG: hypothetical protein HY508_11655 [Acidobacteria bacterium]|nr:hypothetical protein [Acidobacteriota bacterium]